MARKDGTMEIELAKLVKAWLSRWWLILLCAFVGGVGTLLYTLQFVTPLYQASITVYVNNFRSGERIDNISGSNLQASQQLVNTYANIIRSDTVLSKVAREAGVDYSPEEMRGFLSTEQVGKTELFNVRITLPDPEEAAHLANTVASVAPAEIEGFVEGSSAKIIDYARTPDRRCSPSYGRNALIGGVAGGILAIVYVSLRCLLDVRVKEEEDLTALFAYPVLGQIPSFDQPSGGKRSAYTAPYVTAAKRRGNNR